jgi:hypothetical protein
MADFKLLTPQIPFNAFVDSNYTTLDNYGPLNTRGGTYWEGQRNAASSVLADVRYTLTANDTVDFLVVSRLKDIIEADSADVGVRLYYGTDATFYAWSLDATELTGRDGHDFVTTVTETTDDYFRVRVGTTTSMYHELGKVFLGQAFDFGREPVPSEVREYAMEDGKRKFTRIININWEGVTSAKKSEFVESIVPFCMHTPIFLWDSQDRHFQGDELLYMRLDSYRCKPNSREVWDIETNWIEAI